MEAWEIALIVLGALVVLSYVLSFAFKMWAKSAYAHMLQNPATSCDIDAFVNTDRNPVNYGKVVMAHKLRLGGRVPSTDPIPLETHESSHVPGLLVTRKTGTSSGPSYKNVTSIEEILSKSSKKTPVVVATIRMGFGHHRIAYSTCSWALKLGHPTIFHDLLNIDSPESGLIKSTDDLYSKFSRYASEMGGVVEKLWGSMMLSGDADALRVANLTAAHLQPLLTAYPKDVCLITTHQLCALVAAAAGFTNVCNLVVDNFPQWFLTVPRTLNLVQGPVNYQVFMQMGVKQEELGWAGHWCPAELVSNIPTDCGRRIERRKKGKPLRLLIPVGGAGAQRTFIVKFVAALAPLVQEGKVQLFLNAGDHAHMKTAFLEALDKSSLEFDTVNSTEGVMAFQGRLLEAKNEPTKNVTLFSFDEYFPAVATTDILSRVSDVLCCKPSELAFYCLPKLHIRRVGDHEADSAKRASECGDGTLEAREVPDAMEYIDLFLNQQDFLINMNEAIVRNNDIGIYDGCKKAVEMCVARK
eukprot:CAMPEP_0172470974 /NCGR_PEP_ID=MMETSP1065-20121228/67576_1 /TAXON_ID=265537 /ORGANISM="Amphiprora paludosa, Strain CCMP125" /LENGTH=525 /DNA_ID=CAMNT_0013229055 /DNA_START=55 /DNA_END=1632 /DNA_ORIENTATION=+